MVCTTEAIDYFDPEREAYVKDAVTNSHLPMAEQAEYIRLYQETGEIKYMETIVETNMLFVISVAKRFHSAKLTLSDKISAGMVGIMQAIEKFDPSHGASFITYARWWVEQAIRKEVMYYANVVRIPIGSYRQMKEIQKKADEGWTNRALEEMYGMSAKKISLMKISGREVSMSTQLTDDGFSIQDTIATPDTGLEDVDACDEYQFILSKLHLLNEREQKIVSLRFGLEDGIGRTLQEISEMYSITRERIRQIINRALRKLRDYCGYEKGETRLAAQCG